MKVFRTFLIILALEMGRALAIPVAGIEITDGELKLEDTIHIKGAHSDFTCKVDSMQMENQTVEKAVKGDKIGIMVPEHAREHDIVFLVV